jgi:hypothetical protein
MIKTLGGDYEVFPAAIFPGGADRKHIGDTISLRSMEIYGLNENDERVKVDMLYLFKRTIHIHHVVIFMNEDYFGALSYEGHTSERENPYTAFATQADIEQTKDWLRKGLREQNCKDSIMIVRFCNLTLDSKERKLISDTTTDERTLKLY